MRIWKLRKRATDEARMLRFLCVRFFAMGFVVGSAIAACTTYLLVNAQRIARLLGY